MADTLGSVGVILSTLLIQYYNWTGFDPIASLFIAVMIVASVIPLVIDSGRILGLDLGVEKGEDVRRVVSELTTIDGITGTSLARFWPIESEKLVGSVHIHVNLFSGGRRLSLEKIVAQTEDLLKRRLEGLEDLTIQVIGSQ